MEAEGYLKDVEVRAREDKKKAEVCTPVETPKEALLRALLSSLVYLILPLSLPNARKYVDKGRS